MTITAQASDLQLSKPESLLRGQVCEIGQLLDIRLTLTHPEAVDACTHSFKVLLTKPTLGYSPEAEEDELLLTLILKNQPGPVMKKIESYALEEFPGWTMRDWWPLADLNEDDEPF